MFSSKHKSRSSTTLASHQSSSLYRGREKDDVEMGETSASSAPGAESDVENLTPVRGQQPAADGSQQQLPAPAAGAGGPPGSDLYDPRSLKFWTIMFCNFLALFLVALDRTILATAIPRITDEFKSLGDVGWYASAYMLTTAASQLLFGRVYKFYPTKWIFLICIIVFEAGSAICGAAPSSVVFIVGRAIAGMASAGIFTGCMLMFMIVPLHRRPMFQGLFGLVFGIASVMGPLIGGAFTGALSWRWCFWMNLPIGAVSFIAMLLWWNPPQPEVPSVPVMTHIKRLDPIGTMFLVPAIVSLLLALQWGGSVYAWSNPIVIALFVIFGVLMFSFGAVQVLKPETATIPPHVIMQRSVYFGTLFTFFIAGAMLMCIYFIPIWFQTAQGVSPLQSGIYTLPLVLSLVISSMISGIATQKIGYYVPSMILAPCIMAIGTGLMSTFQPHTSPSHWIAYQFLTGFGLGFGMQTAGLAVQTVLPMADVSTGIAINFFAQQLGGAVFTSVGQAILSNLLVGELAGVNGLDPQKIVRGGITALLRTVPPEVVPIIANAYNFACTKIFLAAMGLTFGALVSACFMEWRSIKKPKGAPGGPAAGAAGPEKRESGVPRGAVRISSSESMAQRAANDAAAAAAAATTTPRPTAAPAGAVQNDAAAAAAETSGDEIWTPPPMRHSVFCARCSTLVDAEGAVMVDAREVNGSKQPDDKAMPPKPAQPDRLGLTSQQPQPAVLAAGGSADVEAGPKATQEEDKPTGPRKFWLVAKRSIDMLRGGKAPVSS
ncbi:aflatoxin efflux pump [Gaeumannomyces tritici R3-111a-1]|uniref:Aflatoxin efflux pump n=1 Tax=Gaeumannomyces tritici (strain R3-111a-1) TaxID=644352 RepID=J3NNR8_GAET3|nr:aflatoxin efflux pump [Gaeumannomyces tritici R3-111a-1]EJT77821.1 aflatoxin efflux pump [Gaeumannomyces tritici R3-111a-1]